MAMSHGVQIRLAVRIASSASHTSATSRCLHTSVAQLAASAPAPASGKPRKERLVVLGSGWGGYNLLKKLDKSKYDTWLVSPNTYMAFTPLLAQTVTGTLAFRAAIEPVRSTPEVAYHHAWCDHIDLKAQKLTLTPAYPPAFRDADPLLASDNQQKGVTGGPQADRNESAPAFSKSEPASEPKRYPNARGGHSSTLVRPPHRRAIEQSEHDPLDHAPVPLNANLDVEGKSHTTRHHSHDEGEDWRSVERGRQYEVEYDKLVICIGSYNRTFQTKGVKQNAWFLKDVQNARAIRWRLLETLEQASHPNLTDDERRALLRWVVVGGGPTGSELAGELHDLVVTDIKRLFPSLAPLIRITLIDAAPGILGTFDDTLAKYAREKFARDGIEVLTERKVEEVQRGRLILQPDGEIAFGLLVWSTGVCASPLTKAIENVVKDERGQFLLTDEELRVLKPGASLEAATPQSSTSSADEAYPDVYALGDCAQIRSAPLPATAQVANQKAQHLARLLNGEMEGAEERRFRHKDMGAMAAIGGGKAIVDMPKGKVSGRAAWVLWRSAYTAMSMSWRNRLWVPMIWFTNALFGRDLSRF